jgi:integrase
MIGSKKKTTKKKVMPASPTSEPRGQVKWFGDEQTGEWRARIRYALPDDDAPTDGKKREPPRPWVSMPGIPRDARPTAEAKAGALAAKAKREGWTLDSPTDGGESVRGWFKRWLAYRRAHGGSTAQYRSNFENWIEPAIGKLAMAKVTSADLRQLVAKLDDAVDSGQIRWKSATNIWGTITSAFTKYAGPRGSTRTGLRARDDDPTREVAPPVRGVKTKKVFLYPKEFLALVSCRTVPIRRRRAWAISVYMYLRPGEAEALEWPDIDLENETYTIQRSIDRERNDQPKTPKNGTARCTADIEPALVPLLRAMHKESKGKGRVTGKLGHPTSIARTLRRDLMAAGVERHELHHRSKPGEPAREAMEAHDCRTSGITWMAARGDDLLTIVARAGHSDVEMTKHYVQSAALLRRTFTRSDVFPALPASLLGDDAEVSAPPPSPAGKPAGKRARIDQQHRAIAETHGNRTRAGRARSRGETSIGSRSLRASAEHLRSTYRAVGEQRCQHGW